LNSTLASIAATNASTAISRPRTSEVLRGILTKNPGVKTFSVERILASIGKDRVEASLMMFSIPALVPISAPWSMLSVPTGALACQLASGQKEIKIPRFVRKKSVSRRALAVALHAVLPILEASEKVVRPRWQWVSHPSARRAIGLFVFLLAIAIAYPLFGFNALHATSIFVMSLGMAEQDGLAVLIGVAVGVLSLAVLAASGMSARALREKALSWLGKMGRKLGLLTLAAFLERKGYPRLARIVALQWSDLLLWWNPEKPTAARVSRLAAPNAAGSKQRLPVTTPAAARSQRVPSPRAA
jgi:hypothetical protein